MPDTAKKKRPPKLQPLVNEIDPLTNCDNRSSLSLHSSFGDENELESNVTVLLENEKLLLKPDNLNVVEQLGHGQYGIVEQVIHQPTGHQFAVKRVALKPSGDDDRQRILMDVDISMKVTDCKNIITFYGALIWEGDLWIFMELMDCSLDKFYKLAFAKHSQIYPNRPLSSCTHMTNLELLGKCEECNPIQEQTLGRIASDVISALSYLYSIKVIHRDIKPSNILINKIGVIKLCDFGISGYLVNSVAKTYDAGCRQYMAPERIDPPSNSTGYDIKSDIWSLGISMIELATGKYPYHSAKDFFDQLKMICRDGPPKLPYKLYSPSFEDFISQCLKRDFRERPKYETLQEHPFIVKNQDLDIRKFTELILGELQNLNMNIDDCHHS